jgi:hypothetical protein
MFTSSVFSLSLTDLHTPCQAERTTLIFQEYQGAPLYFKTNPQVDVNTQFELIKTQTGPFKRKAVPLSYRQLSARQGIEERQMTTAGTLRAVEVEHAR